MAVWGYNTIGASSQASVSGQKWAWKWQAPSDCYSLDEFWAYVDRTVAGTGFELDACIYTDDGGTPGNPAHVVANSNIVLSFNLTQSSPGWYSAAYSVKPSITPGAWYWFCILTAKSERSYYDAVANGTIQQALNSSVPDTYPFDDPFPIVDSRTTQRMPSVYMKYAAQKFGTATISGSATVAPATAVKIKTWGYTTVGASNQADAAGNKWGWKWVAPSDISQVDEFWVYCDHTVAGTGFSLYGAIYTTDGGNPGSPVNVVANSGITIVSDPPQNTPAWYHVAYSTKPQITAGQTYWFALLTAKSSRSYYDAVAVGTLQQVQCTTVVDVFPFNDPWDSVDARSSQRMPSVYLVYTAVNIKNATATISGSATATGTGTRIGAAGVIKNGSATISGSATTSGTPEKLTSIAKTRNIQWFYKPAVAPTTVQDVMKCDHAILTKGDETFFSQLRAAGYTRPILNYVRGEAIQDNTGTAQNNQVAWNAGDWADISANHPDWFLLDYSGNRILASQQKSDYWMMDPASVGWQNFFISRMQSQMLLGTWGGIFMDNQELSLAKRQQEANIIPAAYMTATGGVDSYDATPASLGGPIGYNQAASDALYRTAVKSFLTAVKKGISGVVMGNLINLRPQSAWAEYLAIIDGGMNEATYFDWGTGYFSTAGWLDDLALASVANKNLIFVSQTNSQTDNARQIFGYCSYLLVCSPMTSFRFADTSHYNILYWYSDYDIDLGAPVAAYTGPVSNVYSREFQKGRVTVNPVTHVGVISLYDIGTPVAAYGSATTIGAGTRISTTASATISGSATTAGTALRMRTGSVTISGTATVGNLTASKYKTPGTVTISGSATTSATGTALHQATFAQISGVAIVIGTGQNKTIRAAVNTNVQSGGWWSSGGGFTLLW